MTIWCHALPSPPSCPTPIGHLDPTRLPVKPAMTKAPGNDDMVPCTSFSSVMPDLLLRHARPSHCHARPRSGISLFHSSCPTIFPRPALSSSLSCPTPIGHLRLPVKPAMTVWCQTMTIAPGNDDMVPCTSFFSVMSSFFLVMPDPDRASLPFQIAGQAGNDDSTRQ